MMYDISGKIASIFMVGALELSKPVSVLYFEALLIVAAFITFFILYPNVMFLLWRKELSPQVNVRACVSHRFLNTLAHLAHRVSMYLLSSRWLVKLRQGLMLLWQLKVVVGMGVVGGEGYFFGVGFG